MFKRLNKDMDNIKNPNQSWEIENYIWDENYTEITSWLDIAEEEINELEDAAIETTQNKMKRK